MKELPQLQQKLTSSVEKDKDREFYAQYLPGKGESYQASDFDKFGPAKNVYEKIVSRLERRAFYPPDTRIITEYTFFDKDYQSLSPEEQNEFLRQMLSVVTESRIKRELERDKPEEQSADDWGRLKYLKQQEKDFLEEDGFSDKAKELDSIDPATYAKRKRYAWSNFFSSDGDKMDDFYIEQIVCNFGRLEIKSPETVDFLVDFWHKYRGRGTLGEMARALENQDLMYAVKKLLEMVKTEKETRHISALLFRLELGRVGISEQGLEYLGRMYDLEELNSLDYFAKRLTANGEVGIFDDDKKLKAYIELGDLADGQEKIKPVVHDFVHETLFFPKENETKEERAQREEYLRQFQESYFDFYDDEFFQKTGIRFNDLNFKEQGWFLNFYKNSDLGKRNELLDFAKKFGENGLRSFVTMDLDEGNGERILSIAKNLEFGESLQVFSKISEIAELAQEKDRELILKIYKNEKPALPENFHWELLSRAQGVVLEFEKGLSAQEKTGNKKPNMEKLLAGLDQSQIEVDLVASLLIALKKQGEFQKLEEIRDLEIRTVEGEELEQDNELMEKLKEMYRERNSHKSKEDLERLLNDFENHKKNKPRFYLVYFQIDSQEKSEEKFSNLVGFVRSSSFDGKRELPEGERYLGALNINPLLQGKYFGENFLREVVQSELALGAKKLIAHVPQGGVSHKTAQALGFKEIGQEGEYKDEQGKVVAKRMRIELEKN